MACYIGDEAWRQRIESQLNDVQDEYEQVRRVVLRLQGGQEVPEDEVETARQRMHRLSQRMEALEDMLTEVKKRQMQE